MLTKVRLTVSLFFHPFHGAAVTIPQDTEIYVDLAEQLGHYNGHTFDIHPSEYI